MTLNKVFSIGFLLAAWSLPTQAASGGVVITTTQISVAMRSAGMEVTAPQIVLLSNVVARTSTPLLRVESVGEWKDDVSRVRLDCGSNDECLPFVVLVRRNQNNDARKTLVPLNLLSISRASIEAAQSKVVMKSGSSAVLLLDGGHVHIQLAVICKESGIVGQTIRVASRGHEHNYMAEVCSDGLLRATL